MRIIVNVPSKQQRPTGRWARAGTRARQRTFVGRRYRRLEVPVRELGKDPVPKIVRPTVGSSIRTLMSGPSWSRNAAYVPARNRPTVPVEAATAPIAAQVDEVVTTTVRRWSESMRIALLASAGCWSTMIDPARHRDDA